MDFAILDFIQALRCDVLDNIMCVITHAGDIGLVWIAAGIVLLFFKKTRKCGVMVLISLLVCAILTSGIIKPIAARERPFLQRGIVPVIAPPSGYSFPSGHTSSSFAAAMSIFICNKKWGTAAFALAVMIGFSRLYFYVHFPTDVLTGAVLGVFCAAAVSAVSRRIAEKTGKEKV